MKKPKCPSCKEPVWIKYAVIDMATMPKETWYYCEYCGFDWRVVEDEKKGEATNAN